jgi:hypothetical protein
VNPVISFESFILGLSRVSRKGAIVRNVAHPIICTLIATSLLAPPGYTRKRVTFHLANQVLGESLDHFKKQFPQVACGPPINRSGPITRQNLKDPDGSIIVDCCIDIPRQVSVLSPGRSFRLAQTFPCPGYAIFSREKLVCLGFELEGVGLDDLLPEFDREYGLGWEHWRDAEEFDWSRGVDRLRLAGGMRRPATSDDLPSKKVEYFSWTLEVEIDRYYEVP